METKKPSFWWLKRNKSPEIEENANLAAPKLDLEISSSLAKFLEEEENILNSNRDHTDVGSIIEEINRLAAASPLGPYNISEDRSIEDIMNETQRIYMETSKSFEQLSQRSRSSLIGEVPSNISKGSTPTQRSLSPLPHDNSESDTYSEDFNEEHSKKENDEVVTPTQERIQESIEDIVVQDSIRGQMEEDILVKEELIITLEADNKQLKEEIRTVREELQKTSVALEQTKAQLNAKTLASPDLSLELDRILEELKDSKEVNTALQLQLDTVSKTHLNLKASYDELVTSNKILERRNNELENALAKYKAELLSLQNQKDKLSENCTNLSKLLEIEKLQAKSLKLQNEKDVKCIQDLNRQIKEMERIITRKHPDSVSALIVAAKNDATDTNLTARKILEDRIKSLEEEASSRDTQSTKIFLDIQEKFNQMKLKYESHIEDLELHVNDLKTQLKHKTDTFDVYTQTQKDFRVLPQKDTITVCTQTEKNLKRQDIKEDAHLLATIRGLQTDLTNKEKVVSKLQKDLDELRKTNRKLQKEREGSLRSLNERREFRSYPEKLAAQAKNPDEEELKFLRTEREKVKVQLCRIEEDYQALKAKRLHDLSALQEAHERELSACITDVTPLREHVVHQQSTLTNLEAQLAAVKEELLVVKVERDHLNAQLKTSTPQAMNSEETAVTLQKKITFLEKRYEEREFRLRTIVHSLAQKNLTNRNCEQCAERQQQLIGYKLELDQLLVTLRALK